MYTSRIVTKIITGKLRKTTILFVLSVFVIWRFFVRNSDVSTRFFTPNREIVNGRATSIHHAGTQTTDTLDQREGKFESINGKHGIKDYKFFSNVLQCFRDRVTNHETTFSSISERSMVYYYLRCMFRFLIMEFSS